MRDFAILIIGAGIGSMLAVLPQPINFVLSLLLVLLGAWMFWRDYQNSKRRQESAADKLQIKAQEQADTLSSILRNETANSQIHDITVSAIEEIEPSRRLPLYYNIILLTLSTLILAFGSWSVYLWISGKIHPQLTIILTLQWALYFICFIGIPIYNWLNVFIWERKHIISGESRVIKKKKFIVLANNIEDVFNKCDKSLKDMKATSTIRSTPHKFVRVHLPHSIFTVTIRHTRGRRFLVHATSDAKRVEIVYDKGINKRYIQDFEQLIRS